MPLTSKSLGSLQSKSVLFCTKYSCSCKCFFSFLINIYGFCPNLNVARLNIYIYQIRITLTNFLSFNWVGRKKVNKAEKSTRRLPTVFSHLAGGQNSCRLRIIVEKIICIFILSPFPCLPNIPLLKYQLTNSIRLLFFFFSFFRNIKKIAFFFSFYILVYLELR